MHKKISTVVLLASLMLLTMLGTHVSPALAYHANIGDFVWEDLDRDGIQDNDEPGIPGVTVELYDCAGGFIASTTTNAAGIYSFFVENPTPGTRNLYVRFVAPEGYYFSPPNQGADDTVDSDADPQTGNTECFSMQFSPWPFPTDYTRDAGLYKGLVPPPPPPPEKPSGIRVDNTLTASFPYSVGSYSFWEEQLFDVRYHLPCGVVAIYDDGSDIHLWVIVWSKPYLAWGELDKNGDHLIDSNTKDKNRDGVIDRYDLKSDGIEIRGLGGVGGMYKWKVDSRRDGSPADRRDPEITVPSWDLNLNPGGILDGPIEYLAEIPIPSGQTTFQISLKVHASPPDP